jgi:hypothetical protein
MRNIAPAGRKRYMFGQDDNKTPGLCQTRPPKISLCARNNRMFLRFTEL